MNHSPASDGEPTSGWMVISERQEQHAVLRRNEDQINAL